MCVRDRDCPAHRPGRSGLSVAERPRQVTGPTYLSDWKRSFTFYDKLSAMPIIDLLPREFVPTKSGKLFAIFGDYLLVVLISLLLVPGIALIYLSMHGNAFGGLVALTGWIVVLYWLLIQFHNMGFIRLWLSFSLISIVYAIIAFAFAQGVVP